MPRKEVAANGDLLSLLNRWRKRVPLWWWLLYDAVVLAVLIGYTSGLGFGIGIVWLSVAGGIDTVEYLAKRRAK